MRKKVKGEKEMFLFFGKTYFNMAQIDTKSAVILLI